MRNSPNSVGRRASAMRSTVLRLMSRKRGPVEFARQHSWFDPRSFLLKGRRSRGLAVLVFTTLSIIISPIDPKFRGSFNDQIGDSGGQERARRAPIRSPSKRYRSSQESSEG